MSASHETQVMVLTGGIACGKSTVCDLIREMLRQRKASGAIDETKFDEIETDTSAEGEL